MSKEMVSKAEIPGSAALSLIKKFRVTNKRAGEYKRDGNAPAFEKSCEEMHELSEKAGEMGFELWVNLNGKTGHTYPKDYRETLDADNDFEAFKRAVELRFGSRLFNGGRPPSAN